MPRRIRPAAYRTREDLPSGSFLRNPKLPLPVSVPAAFAGFADQSGEASRACRPMVISMLYFSSPISRRLAIIFAIMELL